VWGRGGGARFSYLFGDRYLFSILPNQQHAQSDYLCGRPWVCEKLQYLFGDKYLFSILPNQQRARSDFRLILCMVNCGRVGKYIMQKSKRYIAKDGTRGTDFSTDLAFFRICSSFFRKR
jgi:hypothetical protein